MPAVLPLAVAAAAVDSGFDPAAPINWTVGTNGGLYRASRDLNASGVGSCSASLSFPHCMQKCPEWCWATVIVETRKFYDGGAPGCGAGGTAECGVAGDARGEDCCAAGCSGDCASGATVSTIQAELARLVPGRSFALKGALSEAELTSALQSGRPVLRLTSGHIDVVTACSGGQYTVTDSEYTDPFVAPYSELIQSPYNPQAKWVQSLVPQ